MLFGNIDHWLSEERELCCWKISVGNNQNRMTDSHLVNNIKRPPIPGRESSFSCFEDFELLLKDRDGVKLFKKFLDITNEAGQLDFILACRGLKLVNDTKKISHIIKTIYRYYIRRKRVDLPSDIRRKMSEKIRINRSDPKLFDEAECYIEDILRNYAFKAFLKCDMYSRAFSDSSSSSIADRSM